MSLFSFLFGREGAEIFGILPYDEINVNKELGEILKERAIGATPVVEFYPAVPSFNLAGGSLFTLDYNAGWKLLQQIVRSAGIEPPSKPPVLCAAQSNSINIDEALTNSYTDSYFESVVNAPSRLFQEVARITGKRNILEMVSSMPTGNRGPYAEALQNALSAVTASLQSGQGKLSKGINIVSSILAGGRIDFPSIWESSNYNSNISFTVRLINPFPTDKGKQMKYIIRPLCILMALAIPVSQDEFTYSFPLLVRAKCGELFDIRAGAISSLRIAKGGDESFVRFDRYSPYIVDVTITVESLYNSIIATLNKDVSSERPTLKNYIDALGGGDSSGEPTPRERSKSQTGALPGAISGIAGVLDGVRSSIINGITTLGAGLLDLILN